MISDSGFFQLVSIVWPLSMITMGITYRNDCPFHVFYRLINLPFALIVLGAFAFYAFPKFLILIKDVEDHNDEYYVNDECLHKSDSTSTIEERRPRSYMEAAETFILFFIPIIGLTSLITGSFFVFTIATFLPNSTYISPMYIDSDTNVYCDPTFFWYSFWTFTTIYIGTPALILLISIYVVVSEIIFRCVE